MSETPENTEPTTSPAPENTEPVASPAEPTEPRVVSRRGRRLLIAIIIILVLALIGISALLAGLILPRGGVATGDEAGGVTWVRTIYGWGEAATDQFTVPRKATIGPDGTIWVTDSTRAVAFALQPRRPVPAHHRRAGAKPGRRARADRGRAGGPDLHR